MYLVFVLTTHGIKIAIDILQISFYTMIAATIAYFHCDSLTWFSSFYVVEGNKQPSG